MLALARLLIRALELVLALPFRILRALVFALTTRPSFGPLRHVADLCRSAIWSSRWRSSTRWRRCVGSSGNTSSPTSCATTPSAGSRPPSTMRAAASSAPSIRASTASATSTTRTRPSTLGGYVANPDHKSIPVREVPEHYWQCLVYHEDRHIGGALNPYGIDLVGVLKIPYTTLTRSIALKRPSLGIGGSTLPMQFARVIYNTPPSPDEGGATKLKRKLEGMVAGAGHLSRAHARRGHDAAQAVGRQSHLAGAAHRRRASARGGDHQPRRVRQGGQGPLDRRAVRAGVRRQQADHPAPRQRQAQRGAARPLALHHRGARAHLRGEADRQRGRAAARHLRARQPCRRAARPARQAQAAGGARGVCAGAGPARARQSRHPRQCADAGGALRRARGDEAGLRLRLARARARRHHHPRRGGEPEPSTSGSRRSSPSSTRSTRARSTPATRSTRPKRSHPMPSARCPT